MVIDLADANSSFLSSLLDRDVKSGMNQWNTRYFMDLYVMENAVKVLFNERTGYRVERVDVTNYNVQVECPENACAGMVRVFADLQIINGCATYKFYGIEAINKPVSDYSGEWNEQYLVFRYNKE